MRTKPPDYLAALERYRQLIPVFRERVPALVDFERFEPREFWRRAVVEALRENGFDSNPIIDAMFDPDAHGCGADGIDETITAHIELLNGMARREGDGDRLAAGAVMLAVSLGYSPGEVIGTTTRYFGASVAAGDRLLRGGGGGSAERISVA